MAPDFSLGNALTALSIAFGVWAWVVAWGVAIVRKEAQEMKAIAQLSNATLNAHINQTERRLTMLETEFNWIKQSVNHHGDSK
jgi:cell division protein FtsB